MDYFQMTAPCGLDCFNCHFYLARENEEVRAAVEKMSEEYNVPVEIMLCKGCRHHDGKIPLQKHLFGDSHRCAAYECSKIKEVDFCGDCDEFPCDNLHPYADRAAELPHNMKVFNLCLINRMGLENWAKSKALNVRETYFTKPWTLSER
ncbi:DUF3795 domain-containing protein [Desulfoluna butyratoxydans]|uniref:DUF3795 domain-containing protein n=1 Tax=Desulfoluna butyratoxydans TaxID=231438 RepID=A0A4U8YLG1_9BACT|nr:DUF3795 domain-containing protein [Desulfoluna butyratoxydans]VFQ44795.1 protein of unknown function duf3795 [Desulfoluna butyratoxydans]